MKLAHQEAIEAYKIWLSFNEKAPRRKRIAQFDAYIDSAYLKGML